MKAFLAALLLASITASAALATTDETTDPEPTPEPEPEPQPMPSGGDDDSDPQPTYVYWPCCIKDGVVVPQWNLFMRPERTRRMCERAIARGEALIFECDGISPEALK